MERQETKRSCMHILVSTIGYSYTQFVVSKTNGFEATSKRRKEELLGRLPKKPTPMRPT